MDIFDELRALPLVDGLDDELVRRLLDGSEIVATTHDDLLWLEGHPAASWWVLLEGRVDLVRHIGSERVVLGALDVPGRWAGGFQAWDEAGVYLATGHTAVPSRVLRVPASTLREVLERLPLAVHFIDGLYRTARRIDASARERDSLIALGTLSAGLAHELNNPAAAASRAVGSLEVEVASLLEALRRLSGGMITAEQFAALDALRREIEPASGVGDPIEVADREDEISTWLARHGVERDWVLGPTLAAGGADVAWCDRVLSVLDEEVLGAGLEWVASTLSVAALLTQVRESTHRVSELVAAVKSYTSMDRADLQRTDVTDGLESTLTMLGHKLRDVSVVREYGDLPVIDAYVGELNQVWTNLIDNAVDAMDGAGTLRVSTSTGSDANGAHVLVAIGDSGRGMPPEVAGRAFEAFYTTKDVGKGTGLGLDIARRIVADRHHGTITIDSRPGDTVVSVRLPLRQSDA